MGLAVDRANRHDMKLVRATVDSLPVPRPPPSPEHPQGLCLDKGYDFDTKYTLQTTIASSDYSQRFASVNIRLNRLIQQISDATLSAPFAHENEGDDFNLEIAVADFVEMTACVRGVAAVVNQLFDRLDGYDAPSLAPGFSFSDLDDLARAEYIAEAWHEFASTHPDIPLPADLTPMQDRVDDFEGLFQEIEVFLRDNPVNPVLHLLDALAV